LKKSENFRKGFKTEAEKMALFYREQLNIKPIEPLSANLLADFLNLKLVTPLEIPGLGSQYLSTLNQSDKWSALTMVCLSGIKIVIYNPNHSKARQESDIMHEVAHVICKHTTPKNSYLDGVNIPLRYYNEIQENEAEWLGACLQLPRDALLWALRKK